MMSPLKKLLLIFLLLSCGGISFLYYYWRQATQLPDWYTNQSLNTQKTLDRNSSSKLTAARSRLKEKLEASIAKSNVIAPESTLPLDSSTSSKTESTERKISKKSVEIELSEPEVNDLVMTTVAQRLGSSKILANTPDFHTTIKDGILESGTVINLENVPKNQLAESESDALDKVIKTFPFLEKQKVYVAISGKPKIENGEVKLDENTKIKLGNLSLSIPELSERLGIPQEKIEQKLKLSLPLEELKVEELEIADDKALLKGWVD